MLLIKVTPVDVEDEEEVGTLHVERMGRMSQLQRG